MVGVQDEGLIKVTSPSIVTQDFYVNVSASKTIEAIFTEIGEKLSVSPDEIEVTFKAEGREITLLSAIKQNTLYEAGLWPSAGVTDYEMVVTYTTERYKNMAINVLDVSDDELILGASASPTTGDLAVSSSEDYPSASFPDVINTYVPALRRNAQQLSPVTVEHSSYVGLVNQAMTCYLNSLLQALYMTPEFRNALYNWEFDGANETRSIPYQLQKLFLNLQTSSKPAVETTDLTTSFGWQGSDAWHQHDIQELCRVMFDALEQKFKDTKQANLINDLYEGKMLDYVKCLECSTEKSREDTFLDIPLPVRPFGSNVAYNSVEEALRAFVQPETLDGNNQYFCEKCNKKCDAHKGLKFTKFPYLLTLHLKRFDFDYNTMHRIKLNDKVVFPELLNLNSFISSNRGKMEYTANIGEGGDVLTKGDDCSTTDSGSADDESCQGTDLSSTVNGNDDNCADSDEGIDVSSGPNQDADQNGPYVYELFSIMIHSGSASGGHYYAYVKDFDKNLWFCFNDQSVTAVTAEDIKKTYGGGPHRTYYSGAYSSSTNAYMLMYRQIDKARNCSAITVDEFPPHIQKLLKQMRTREEEELLNRQKEDNMVKITVWYWHATSGLLQDIKISTRMDMSLTEIAQHVVRRLKLDGLVDEIDCRLVAYDKQNECISRSFDSGDVTYQEAITPMFYTDWMLQIREPGTEWKTYKPGGVQMKVYPINLDTEEIDEPKMVRVDVDETVGELKQEIASLFDTDPISLQVVLAKNSNDPRFLNVDTDIVPFDFKYLHYKIYIANVSESDPEAAKRKTNKLTKLVQLYGYVIALNLLLPETDEATLDALSIPSLDCNQNVDKPHEVIGERETDSPSLRVSPQPGLGGMGGDGYDQSNSEDSSLSDSDRTLIGDAPVDCVGLSSDSASATDQYMASPSDPCQDTYNHDILGVPGDEMYWDHTEPLSEPHRDSPHPNYYFKVTGKTIVESNAEYGGAAANHCKVMVDRRITLEMLKKNLEPVLLIPSEYFKVFKCYHIQEEWTRLADTLRCMKDGEKLLVKLGRVLKEDEYQCRIYHITPHKTDPSSFLLDQVIAKNETVESVKRNVLRQAKKQHNLDIPYNRCRLREKCLKRPKKVYLDDQKFGEEIITSCNFEMYLQELTDPETVTSEKQVVVFLRKFSPSELTLGPFQEAVLDYLTMDHLRSKITDLTGIPLENLDVAHVKGNYPFDMHILEVSEELEWNPKVSSLEQWPWMIEDGSMIFYRDNREPLKELTVEEKRDLRQKEDARLGRTNIRSSGRERALKIYLLDNSPSKLEDDID